MSTRPNKECRHIRSLLASVAWACSLVGQALGIVVDGSAITLANFL